MTATRLRAGLLLAPLVLLAGVLGRPTPSFAASPPVKEILETHIGQEVNATTGSGICSTTSGDACQPGRQSSQSGGFTYPRAIAVDDDTASTDYGDLYVADSANHRVQELSSSGAFMAMFGWDVNRTKVLADASQSERDLCTAESKDTCQAGIEGAGYEQFEETSLSVAIDPTSGDLFISEIGELRSRVRELTPTGSFIMEIGREVNATTKGNLCTEEEIQQAAVECAAAAPTPNGTEVGDHGAFAFEAGAGNAIFVGGPQGLLYVGERGRVEEFKTSGVWAGEVELAGGSSITEALAVDSSGDIYLVVSGSAVIHKLGPSGGELMSFEVQPFHEGETVVVRALALDSFGGLAVTAWEALGGARGEFGVLYDAATGHRVTDFKIPTTSEAEGTLVDAGGLAFNAQGDLYTAITSSHEIVGYTALPVAELVSTPGGCELEGEAGASVAFRCTLAGEVDPEGVSETDVFFEWGTTQALGEVTGRESAEAPTPVTAALSGLRPNETFHYQLAGFDHNSPAPEELQSEQAQVSTPSVAPRILDALSTSFVSSSSAVLFGELNPENATTAYQFQYAKACVAGEVCPPLAQAPSMVETETLHSTLYGDVPVALETSGLQPARTYRYRLMAVNEKGEGAVSAGGTSQLPEATFTTAPALSPGVATGAVSAVSATSATVSGRVDPDGRPASYAFELGIDEGAGTHYVVVFSGSAGEGSQPVEEQLQLSGLQPGRTYAYRMAIQSGYIQDSEHVLRGAPLLFTTAGVSAVLAVPGSLPLLSVPNIDFPKEAEAKKGTKAKHKGVSKPRGKVHRKRKAKARKKK